MPVCQPLSNAFAVPVGAQRELGKYYKKWHLRRVPGGITYWDVFHAACATGALLIHPNPVDQKGKN